MTLRSEVMAQQIRIGELERENKALRQEVATYTMACCLMMVQSEKLAVEEFVASHGAIGTIRHYIETRLAQMAKSAEREEGARDGGK